MAQQKIRARPELHVGPRAQPTIALKSTHFGFPFFVTYMKFNPRMLNTL